MRNDNETSVITPVTPKTEAQTTSDSSDLLPDVTSNISEIMTPDLPGSVSEEDLLNPSNQDLLGAKETLQNPLNDADGSQVIVPENPTVITPKVQISVETTSENVTITWKNYTSPKHGISIDYPLGATITEGRESPYDPYKDLVILDVDKGFSFGVLETDVMPSELEQFSRDLLNGKVNSYDYKTYTIPIQEVTPVIINNKTYYKFVDSAIDKETDKSETVQESYLINNNNRTYDFLFTITPEKMNSTEGIREHMIESIKFIEQNTSIQKNVTIPSSSITDDIVRDFVINDDNPGKDPIIGHCELMNKGGFNNPLKDCMYEYYDLMMPDYKQEVFK